MIPAEVLFGTDQGIFSRRDQIKRTTLARRKIENYRMGGLPRDFYTRPRAEPCVKPGQARIPNVSPGLSARRKPWQRSTTRTSLGYTAAKSPPASTPS